MKNKKIYFSKAGGVSITALLVYFVFLWIFILFNLLGNSSDSAMFGNSVFKWMISRWHDSTLYSGDYSHGWLIPLVSLYVIWMRRNEIRLADKYTYWPAVIIIISALFLHWAGYRAQQPRLSLFSFILLCWSVPLFLTGKHVGKLLVFPCFFLIFCIPMNFFDSFTFPLRLFATKAAVLISNGLGMAVERTGTLITSSSGDLQLGVDDPCSGIRSLLAITALTTAYAFFVHRTLHQRIILVLSSIPLAVAGNILRIVSIILVAKIAGTDKALSFYHDYSGYLVFVFVVLLMIGISELMLRLNKNKTECKG